MLDSWRERATDSSLAAFRCPDDHIGCLAGHLPAPELSAAQLTTPFVCPPAPSR